mgnify:CR=1 FL=1
MFYVIISTWLTHLIERRAKMTKRQEKDFRNLSGYRLTLFRYIGNRDEERLLVIFDPAKVDGYGVKLNERED